VRRGAGPALTMGRGGPSPWAGRPPTPWRLGLKGLRGGRTLPCNAVSHGRDDPRRTNGSADALVVAAAAVVLHHAPPASGVGLTA
jgi:hypothetical protein